MTRLILNVLSFLQYPKIGSSTVQPVSVNMVDFPRIANLNPHDDAMQALSAFMVSRVRLGVATVQSPTAVANQVEVGSVDDCVGFTRTARNAEWDIRQEAVVADRDRIGARSIHARFRAVVPRFYIGRSEGNRLTTCSAGTLNTHRALQSLVAQPVRCATAVQASSRQLYQNHSCPKRVSVRTEVEREVERKRSMAVVQ